MTSALAGGEDAGGGSGSLPPFKMIRTLEFVQDSIVGGDHAAGEMQQYLLRTIDKRLRTADAAIFDNPRNVDAALIYAMSGGNPATLDILASRDKAGRFDERVVQALDAYFSGRVGAARPRLETVQKEFRDTAIGAYLTLITANTMIQTDPARAIELFDWVGLLAPGTILEESALRREIAVATAQHDVAKAFACSERYVRVFLHSPYAGQFADLFVDLVVGNDAMREDDHFIAIIDEMDADRRREIYLRIARAAIVEGKEDLARAASLQAKKIEQDADGAKDALAGLYAGMADISSERIEGAIDTVAAVRQSDLSPRDKALQAAALAVGQSVLSPPDPDSLEQAPSAKSDETQTDRARRKDGVNSAGSGMQENTFEDFVGSRQASIESIDALLKRK